MLWDLRRYELEIDRARAKVLLARGFDTPSQELASIEAQLARAPRGRADSVAGRLGLGADEMSFVWLVIAAGHDPLTAPHVEAVGGADCRGGASFALHARVWELDTSRARRLVRSLHDRHPMFGAGLLTSAPALGDAPGVRVWRASQRFASFLAGTDSTDAVILANGGPLVPADGVIVSKPQAVTVRLLEQAFTTDASTIVLLEGSAGVGRRTLAALAAHELKRPILEVDLSRVAPTEASLSAIMTALAREVFLVPDTIVLLSNIDELAGGPERLGEGMRAVLRATSTLDAPVVLTTSIHGLALPLTRTPVRLKVPAPASGDRLALWQRAIKRPTTAPLTDIAYRYKVTPGAIASAAHSASLLSQARGATAVEAEDLIGGIRATIAERFGGLAQRIETSARWTDLVLTSETSDQIRGLLARVKHSSKVLDDWGFRSRLARGTGIAALFSGPPGTGKTMVAGVIANELGLELYQVDLSRIVSKWVGETEKQLSQVFDAAEAGHALLLFDEADSLFAKRTEVKGANDRYANLEVNYLLQRVEAFEGITVLTTNMDTAIDPALKRRLAAHVVFWPPDDDERVTLWKAMISDQAPVQAGLDFRRLSAEFPDMTGANIRNAVISAAFLAAAEGSTLRQAHLMRAAKLEYGSMGRVLGRGDL